MTVKKKKLKNAFYAMSSEDLAVQLEELRKQLFRLRFDAATAHVKDYSLYKKIRRSIACVLTLLRNRELGKGV